MRSTFALPDIPPSLSFNPPSMASTFDLYTPQEEGTSQAEPKGPTRFFAQLLKDKFSRKISIHPKDVTNILCIPQVHEDDVESIMKAIRRGGYASTPMPSAFYASDRGEKMGPVLLEGSHRIEALRRLLCQKEATWLNPGETPENFKVVITVFKNLTLDDESRITQEFKKLAITAVRTTLVQQVLAINLALITCRLHENLPDRSEVSLDLLCQTYPEYKRYQNQTLRSWKNMAHALSPESLNLLLEKCAEFKVAFSKKTIQESSMLTTLQHYPGVQLWYLQRLLYLVAQGKIRRFKASYFKKMAKSLQRLANAILDFSACLEHIFDLENMANTFRDIVNNGKPSQIAHRELSHKILVSFYQIYLCSPTKDQEVQAVLQERKKHILLFPHIFYEIVAEIHFEKNYEEADKMFEAPLTSNRPRFTSRAQILQKRSHSETEPKTTIQKKKKRYMLRSIQRPVHKVSPPGSYSEQIEETGPDFKKTYQKIFLTRRFSRRFLFQR